MLVSKKIKTLDLSKIKDVTFQRFYHEVIINGKDHDGHAFELIIGKDAANLIRQATTNIYNMVPAESNK